MSRVMGTPKLGAGCRSLATNGARPGRREGLSYSAETLVTPGPTIPVRRSIGSSVR